MKSRADNANNRSIFWHCLVGILGALERNREGVRFDLGVCSLCILWGRVFDTEKVDYWLIGFSGFIEWQRVPRFGRVFRFMFHNLTLGQWLNALCLIKRLKPFMSLRYRNDT